LLFHPILPASALRVKDAGIMLDSLWQDAVVKGLLAAAVSLGLQWLAPKVIRAYRRLRAGRVAR
jgi:hypothetical protein